MRFESIFQRIVLLYKQQNWSFRPYSFPIHNEIIDTLQQLRIPFDVVEDGGLKTRRFRDSKEMDEAISEFERHSEVFIYKGSVIYKDSKGFGIIVIANFP